MKENFSSIEERRSKYYILNEIYKNKYKKYVKHQEITHQLWFEMHDAYNDLLDFINRYGKYPYLNDEI